MEALKAQIGAKLFFKARDFAEKEGIPFDGFEPRHVVKGLNSECTNQVIVLKDKRIRVKDKKGGREEELFR